MATLICRRLTFGYPGADHNIFDDLDLTLDTGWRCALVGRNGRGKTTLLRLLDAQLEPDGGSLETPVATRYFPHAPADPLERAIDVAKDAVAPFRRWETKMTTLLERGDESSLQRYGEIQDRYQRAGGYQVDALLETELTALGLSPATWRRPFSQLSGGEQTRVLLASLFSESDRYPLIDEPTNHLDRDGRAQLAEYLRAKSGFLLVSHDRAFLDACADHVVALNTDTVEVQRTRFSRWRAEFATRLAGQEARNSELRKEIVGFDSTARQRRAGAAKREGTKGPHADKGFIGARAARQMKRAKTAERRARDAAQARRETLVDTEKHHLLKLPPQGLAPRNLGTASNLSVVRGRPLFEPVSFQISPGDRIAIVGPNGSGKTSLLDLIRGIELTHDGVWNRPAHIDVSHVRQVPRWQVGNLDDQLEDAGIDASRFRQIMAVLGVRGSILDRPLQTLSHGQQKKLELARAFLEPADLLLWDEPLNYIDIDTREQIEAALLADRATLVVVEHDAAFVDAIATKTVVLNPLS